MRHVFSAPKSAPARAFDARGNEFTGFVGNVRVCAHCGAFEAMVIQHVLGRPRYVAARGPSPESLREGALRSCKGPR